MAQKNLKDKEAVRQENIEQTVSATEQFYNEHKKLIWGIVAAVLVVGLGILAYQKFIYQPKCVEAMEQCYPAEMNFQAGEYELALSGDGNNLGFADIIDQYGAKAGKAASQRWRLLRTDTPGEYLIFSQGNLVLTLNPNDGTLTLSPKTGDATQRWRLEPV